MEFCKSKAAAELIHEIVLRYEGIAKQQGVEVDRMSLQMDIEACHCNGNPLMLVELLASKDGDFIHDVGGIRRHINRETGALGDCFLPRYSDMRKAA